jgi:hypothetical protein
LTGEDNVMVRASIAPLEALVPNAEAHSPLTIADDVAFVMAEYVVAPVVFTVILLSDPKDDVTTSDDCEIEAIVPKAPVKPSPPRPRPPEPRPAPGDPVGRGRGLPLLPPPGTPPFPPKPFARAAQPEVLVTVTRTAVIDLADDPELLGRAPATVMQSPVAREDSVMALTLVTWVEVAHATVVVPLVDCTAAPAAEIAVILPETALKAAVKFGRPDAVGDGVAAEASEGAPDPPPQAAAASATTARPAADKASRLEVSGSR